MQYYTMCNMCYLIISSYVCVFIGKFYYPLETFFFSLRILKRILFYQITNTDRFALIILFNFVLYSIFFSLFFLFIIFFFFFCNREDLVVVFRSLCVFFFFGYCSIHSYPVHIPLCCHILFVSDQIFSIM